MPDESGTAARSSGLIAEWALSSRQQSWMSMSVQLGFVVGALASALLNLADR